MVKMYPSKKLKESQKIKRQAKRYPNNKTQAKYKGCDEVTGPNNPGIHKWSYSSVISLQCF